MLIATVVRRQPLGAPVTFDLSDVWLTTGLYVPFALLGELLIALPLFLLAKRAGFVRLPVLMAIGAFAALVIALLAGRIVSASWLWSDMLAMITGGAICGFIFACVWPDR